MTRLAKAGAYKTVVSFPLTTIRQQSTQSLNPKVNSHFRTLAAAIFVICFKIAIENNYVSTLQ